MSSEDDAQRVFDSQTTVELTQTAVRGSPVNDEETFVPPDFANIQPDDNQNGFGPFVYDPDDIRPGETIAVAPPASFPKFGSFPIWVHITHRIVREDKMPDGSLVPVWEPIDPADVARNAGQPLVTALPGYYMHTKGMKAKHIFNLAKHHLVGSPNDLPDGSKVYCGHHEIGMEADLHYCTHGVPFFVGLRPPMDPNKLAGGNFCGNVYVYTRNKQDLMDIFPDAHLVGDKRPRPEAPLFNDPDQAGEAQIAKDDDAEAVVA